MRTSIAKVTLTGTAPMTHSHMHDAPKLEGERPDDYDARTWRHKLNVNADKTSVVIPAFAVKDCLAQAARYSKQQIPGQGKATWTKKFEAGIAIMDNPDLNLDPASVNCVVVSVNADGVRGSGKRVLRRFPLVPAGWTTTFEVYILDPIIKESVFREMAEIAGTFIGLGQYRPQNGGTNGRFLLSRLDWQDNRQIAA